MKNLMLLTSVLFSASIAFAGSDFRQPPVQQMPIYLSGIIDTFSGPGGGGGIGLFSLPEQGSKLIAVLLIPGGISEARSFIPKLCDETAQPVTIGGFDQGVSSNGVELFDVRTIEPNGAPVPNTPASVCSE